MNEPTELHQFKTTAAVWPRSLIVPLAIALILLSFFTTLELPNYVHGNNIPRGTTWVVFLSYCVAIVVWLTLETKSTWLSRPTIDRPGKWFRRHLKRMPLFIVCFIVFGYGLRLLGFALIGFPFKFGLPFFPALLIYEAVKAALLYCCWLGLAFGVLSFAKMRQQSEHLLATQKTLIEAKLMQLKGQLRPHFLFNTLNTISSLMQVDVARADRMVTQLGDLLRANLDISDRDIVSLKEELDLLEQYLGIMQERFTGRVTVHWEIAEDALETTVPTMLLQPILENAFKHGIEQSTDPEVVTIQIDRVGERLVIVIHNTGSTLPAEIREGWGIRNTRERLRLLYGSFASLRLRNENNGVTAEIDLPWLEPGATIDIPLAEFGL